MSEETTDEHDAQSEIRSAALADLGRLCREIINGLVTLFIVLLPILVRFACIALAVGGAAYAFMPVWLAFGADPIALIPTGALILAPLAFVLAGGYSWAGLVVAGLANFIMAALALALAPIVLHLLCVGIIGGAVFNELKNSERTIQDETP